MWVVQKRNSSIHALKFEFLDFRGRELVVWLVGVCKKNDRVGKMDQFRFLLALVLVSVLEIAGSFETVTS